MNRKQSLRDKADLLELTASNELNDQWKSKLPRGVALRANQLRCAAKDCRLLADKIESADQ